MCFFRAAEFPATRNTETWKLDYYNLKEFNNVNKV